jgi:hypothetical protein
MISPIKVGDLVELQPTNKRNRQLRSQDGKYIWTVIKIGPTICFGNDEGIYIKSVGSDHERWVQRDDISIHSYRENLENE